MEWVCAVMRRHHGQYQGQHRHTYWNAVSVIVPMVYLSRTKEKVATRTLSKHKGYRPRSIFMKANELLVYVLQLCCWRIIICHNHSRSPAAYITWLLVGWRTRLFGRPWLIRLDIMAKELGRTVRMASVTIQRTISLQGGLVRLPRYTNNRFALTIFISWPKFTFLDWKNRPFPAFSWSSQRSVVALMVLAIRTASIAKGLPLP